MAERRMFAVTIIDSDLFLDMPLSAQALYFHLSMRADDEGFINNPKKIQRMIGTSEDDLKLLIAKNFLIPFESGIVVIKHWKIHNYLRNDRFKPTMCQEEKALLREGNDKTYALTNECLPLGIPNDNQMDTQVRLGKVSIGKENIYIVEQNEKPDVSESVKLIVYYLNEKSGKKFKADSESTKRHIKARLNEGYKVDEFKAVIDKKCADWKGTNMDKYLRPETLFGTKFESYLNEKSSGGNKAKSYDTDKVKERARQPIAYKPREDST